MAKPEVVYVYVLANDAVKWFEVLATRAMARERAKLYPESAKMKVKRAKLTILG